jgi:hypothetical protein
MLAGGQVRLRRLDVGLQDRDVGRQRAGVEGRVAAACRQVIAQELEVVADVLQVGADGRFGLAVGPRGTALAAVGCGSGGQLREIGGGSPVNLRYGVGVVPQCGGTAAAMTEARRGVTQVEPRREQLASRVAWVPQLDASMVYGSGL